MTYFWQLAALCTVQQNWPAIICHQLNQPYANAKGHPPHKYVIYSQTKVIILQNPLNKLYLKLFDLIVNTHNSIRGFCLSVKDEYLLPEKQKAFPTIYVLINIGSRSLPYCLQDWDPPGLKAFCLGIFVSKYDVAVFFVKSS